MVNAGKFTGKLLATIPLLFALHSLQATLPAQGSTTNDAPKTWYVSVLTPTNNGTGQSWKTAWRDFSAINWALINPGDRIQIDTGSAPQPGHNSYLFYGNLRVPKSGLPGKPITIEVSNEPGHNGGIASIQPTGRSNVAIDLQNSSHINIQGTRWGSIYVLGYQKGIFVGPGSTNVTLKNIELDSNQVGVEMLGAADCRQLIIHDNQTNVSIVPPPRVGALPYFDRCWIHNKRAGNTIGVRISGAPITSCGMTINRSIFGPGLSTAVKLDRRYTNMGVSNSLFLNSIQHNVEKISDFSAAFTLRNVTSFQTPLNSQGQSHSNLKFGYTYDEVSRSVFYGGVVDVAGSRVLGSSNFQFKTSGNTSVLSSSSVDPLFVSNVAGLPNNASFSQLQSLNFALRPNSPALNAQAGSQVTSVSQLLSTNQ
jgi:hypothetical protein